MLSNGGAAILPIEKRSATDRNVASTGVPRQTSLSEVDRDALVLPIAIADGFGPVAPAKLGWQVQRLRLLLPLGGLGQRAFGFRAQIRFLVAHEGLV